MLAPGPRAWSFGATLTSTSLHIEHIESEDPGLVTPYWHDQKLLIGQLDLWVARGLRPGMGVGVTVPLRTVRDRIQFEDLARQPYLPPEPDTHHRNETLVDLADPQLAVLFTRPSGPWILSANLGTTFPLGQTEPNPFELGRAGLPHQHIQFGTGTWMPMATLSSSRSFGEVGTSVSASARVSLYENSHGYRAGNLYDALVRAHRRFATAWGINGGLVLDHESPEKWNGQVETEGNLGRTDLMVTAGIVRVLRPVGSLGLTFQVPIKTWATGEQVEFPLIVSLDWTH